MVLLTWAGRCTPSPAASTSECDLGEERRRPCTSAFGKCRTGKSPRETAEISHQSEVGLEMGKTTFELSVSLEEWKVAVFSTQSLCFAKHRIFAPICFFKEHLDLETGHLTSSDTHDNNNKLVSWVTLCQSHCPMTRFSHLHQWESSPRPSNFTRLGKPPERKYCSCEQYCKQMYYVLSIVLSALHQFIHLILTATIIVLHFTHEKNLKVK